MKKIILLICFCFSALMYSQTNKEIASIYIKRAEKNFNEQKTSEAVKSYVKALKYIDLSSNTDISIPKLGMVLFAKANNFSKAKAYSKDYFRLATDKTTDEYLSMLELYVDILDKLEGEQGTKNDKNETIEVSSNSTVQDVEIKASKPIIQEVKKASSIPLAKEVAQNKPKLVAPADIIENPSLPKEVVSERITTSYSPRKKGGYTKLELAEQKAYPSTINADKIYPFNSNGVAIFEKSGKLGLINDQGRVFLYPEEYKDFVAYDGYIILKDRKQYPTKLYCFNSNINFGFILPPVREYNSLSSTYGKVMKPRGNGILITYPNNSLNVLKFDLNRGEFIAKPTANELLKRIQALGESNIEYEIDKNRDLLKIKMGEKWIVLGAHLGGDIYPLFKEDYSIYGYAFNKRDDNSEKRTMSYLGAYYNGRIQASSSKETWWLDKRSSAIKTEEIVEKKYKGEGEIIKVRDKTYKVESIADKQ